MGPPSKKTERRQKDEVRAENRLMDSDLVDDEMVAMTEKMFTKSAVDQGVAELFEKKLTKEEKKELAAVKKAEREARKEAAASAGGADDTRPDDADEATGEGKGVVIKPKAAVKAGGKAKGKESKVQRMLRDQAELDADLEEAREAAVRMRSADGAYLGPIDGPNFSMPNPGGGADLLEKASFTLQRGRSYGLIGRNGCGKSTLLRNLACRRVGAIHPAVTVHYVAQEVGLTEESLNMTPVQIVVHANIERRLLLDELAMMQAGEGEGVEVDGLRQQAVMAQLQVLESETAHVRAEQLLINLGFSDELRARPLRALSGGWRVRTMLAAAIFAQPDMLLLDEPTNHLSIGAVLWLARELTTNPVWKERIICVVSHDRYFLDEVCGDVLHISAVARRLTQSHGSYSTWAKRRGEQQQAFQRMDSLRKEEIKELREYAGHGFKYGGSSASINKMSMKAKQADKLEEQAREQQDELAALQEDVELPLDLKSGGKLDGFLVQLLDVSFGYPGSTKPLFRECEMGIDSSTRIVLLGENGNGKTTLVKILTGELEPTAGEVRRKAQARIAIVNQHHADQLDLEKTPLEFLKALFPGDGSSAHENTLRAHLDRMGVPTVKQGVPAHGLSGGQRSRVALAAVSYVEPHVLVLDEPTNNLDLESVAALAACVQRFEGAVILVSHDQFFVSQVANEVWVVGQGKVKKAESFEKYRAAQLRKLPAASS
mmetsp:Transcript_23896/g.55249  ORF Transcript_23896/g.55249 Transcript_23896/m.55249 type:complete len:716 (+) Transcript_23896:63-2210(+)